MLSLDPGSGLNEQMIALPDGRKLRTVVAGNGTPPVVFEAGMSAAASGWAAVQRALAEHSSTVSYDRAGLGGSDPDPHPRGLGRVVADLDAMLDASGITDAIVLVAHSWGGPIARTFTARHPDRVAALVLVDDTTADIMTPGQAAMLRRFFDLTALLSRVHLHRPVLKALVGTSLNTMVPADRVIMERDLLAASAARTGRREAREVASHLEALGALQAAAPPAGIPFIKIIGGRPDRGPGGRRLRELHLRASQAEVERHPRGRMARADLSGHAVPQQQPDIVVAEVTRVLTTLRGADT